MNVALIFAGGTGSRMRLSSKPKQFLELNGKAIIIYTLEHFERHPQIDAIVVVCLKSWIGYLQSLLEQYHLKKVKWIVSGGNTGQESIRNGLMALWEDKAVPREAIVLIHDGVRPLINADVISSNIACATKYGNAITVTPAIETIISVTASDEVDNIYDRSRCRLARAPQTFRLSAIVAKHLKAIEDGNTLMIDSAMLMSHYGEKLHIVEGPPENIKITTPSDFYIFKAMYKTRENSEVWGVE